MEVNLKMYKRNNKVDKRFVLLSKETNFHELFLLYFENVV